MSEDRRHAILARPELTDLLMELPGVDAARSTRRQSKVTGVNLSDLRADVTSILRSVVSDNRFWRQWA